MIRAKFKCASVTKFEGGGESVSLSAVTADTPENKTWSRYTPSGDLKIGITNPDACGKFEPGKSYFLDFTPAEG